MTGLSLLLLGVGLGLRHATDADHVVAVSALVQREPGVWRAARIAALWGAGHTLTFLALGLAIVLGGVRLPGGFEPAAEVLVGSMLVGLGAWHVARGRESRQHDSAASAPSSCARPLLVGLVHGLAGSATIALLAATTIPSRPLAVTYLGLVALGTVTGMVALTIVMAWPITWTLRREARLQNRVSLLAGGLSLVLGLSVLMRSVIGAGAP